MARKRLSAKEKQRIESIFERLSKIIEPKSDLEFSNNFELLVAVTLSAQATDKQVNKVTEGLFQKIKTPQDVVDMGVDKFTNEIRSIGLFRNKGKNIVKACETLIEKHNSQVPEDRKALQALAGVGKKTAGVVLNVGFGHPTIPVDTHVFRLSKRLGLCNEKTPDKTEDALLKVVPKDYLHTAHHLLILHGRYICKARKPLCQDCVVAELCNSKDKNLQPSTPKAKSKPKRRSKTKTKAKPKAKAGRRSPRKKTIAAANKKSLTTIQAKAGSAKINVKLHTRASET